LDSRGSQERISSGVRRESSSVAVRHSRGFPYQRESLLFYGVSEYSTGEGAVALLQPPLLSGLLQQCIQGFQEGLGQVTSSHNLNPLNRMLVKNRFTMETPSTITAALCQGDWTVSIVLTDAYLHVPMHPSGTYSRLTSSHLILVTSHCERFLRSPVTSFWFLCLGRLTSRSRSGWSLVPRVIVGHRLDRSYSEVCLLPSGSFSVTDQ
jgi:hypothetical protein